MDPKIVKEITKTLNSITDPLSKEFLDKLNQGDITREKNSQSHFCVYFAAIDPASKKVFMGHHKKSGLWLFNGGHLDENETLNQAALREMVEEWGFVPPKNGLTIELLTISNIEAGTRPCKIHFDHWYFIRVDSNNFNPDPDLLATEFYSTQWLSLDEARQLSTNPVNFTALDYISQIFNQK